MRRSLAAGKPESIEAVRTIADSLGAPHAAPYSFELCRRALDDLVLVSDEALTRAMGSSSAAPSSPSSRPGPQRPRRSWVPCRSGSAAGASA